MALWRVLQRGKSSFKCLWFCQVDATEKEEAAEKEEADKEQAAASEGGESPEDQPATLKKATEAAEARKDGEEVGTSGEPAHLLPKH